MRFFVPGIPAPGGSKRAFIPHRKGETPAQAIARGAHPNIIDMGGQRTKDWRASVVHEAAIVMRERGGLFDVPLRLDVVFIMPRPKGHFGKNGLLPSAPEYHTVKPDRTKLLRALEDALSGVIWRDDALIVAGEPRKVYGFPAGADIQIEPMPHNGVVLSTGRKLTLARDDQPVLL